MALRQPSKSSSNRGRRISDESIAMLGGGASLLGYSRHQHNKLNREFPTRRGRRTYTDSRGNTRKAKPIRGYQTLKSLTRAHRDAINKNILSVLGDSPSKGRGITNAQYIAARFSIPNGLYDDAISNKLKKELESKVKQLLTDPGNTNHKWLSRRYTGPGGLKGLKNLNRAFGKMQYGKATGIYKEAGKGTPTALLVDELRGIKKYQKQLLRNAAEFKMGKLGSMRIKRGLAGAIGGGLLAGGLAKYSKDRRKR